MFCEVYDPKTPTSDLLYEVILLFNVAVVGVDEPARG